MHKFVCTNFYICKQICDTELHKVFIQFYIKIEKFAYDLYTNFIRKNLNLNLHKILYKLSENVRNLFKICIQIGIRKNCIR